MSRSLETALAFAVLTAFLGGVAHAAERPARTHIVHHLAPETVIALDDADAPAAAVRPYTISAAGRAQLAALATASTMPTADADLRMWSAREAAVTSGSRSTVERRIATDPLHRFARGIISRTSSLAMSLTRSAMRFIGTPYVFGGTSASGFDCSGYTQHVFAMLGISLPRTADAQYYAGHAPAGGMVAGDLVFFQTYLPGPSHVGIYLGGGRFIHSSGHGVRISGLAERYWASRYLGARRMVATVALH